MQDSKFRLRQHIRGIVVRGHIHIHLANLIPQIPISQNSLRSSCPGVPTVLALLKPPLWCEHQPGRSHSASRKGR